MRMRAAPLGSSLATRFCSCSPGSSLAHSLASYSYSGYAVPDVRLTSHQLERARSAVERVLQLNSHLQPDQLVNAHLEQPEEANVPAGVVRGASDLFRIACLPAVTVVAAQCLGTDDVILWACQLFAKPPREGRAVPWHQDGVYWPIVPLNACTVWVAVDRSTRANGGLLVIPRSHSAPLKHETIDDGTYGASAIRVAILPETLGPEMLARATAIELEPGMMSVHDAMLVHGSEANLSDTRRAGLAISFMAADSHFRRDVQTFAAREGGLNLDFSSRPLVQVRGHNRHNGNTNFTAAPSSLD
mmetsp:Transcript_34935/g.111189  ORF Transcript_34935/g.111189 Transcript_34935/m.111189 type:complete len:302 (+) Transcript_34935:2-907(+)|eukprot:scaffold9211_cov127-Isochrysis_galbana.AAC.3